MKANKLSKYRYQFRNGKKMDKSEKYDVLDDREKEEEKKRIKRRNKKHEKGILKKWVIDEYPYLELRPCNLNF